MQRVWSQLDQSSNERFRCFLMSSNTTITSHDQQSCIGQQNKLSILYDVSQLILCKMRVEWIVYIGQNGIFGEIRNISTIYVDCKQIDHIVHQLSDTEICSITSMYLRRLCIISGINMRCGRMLLPTCTCRWFIKAELYYCQDFNKTMVPPEEDLKLR